MSKEQKHIEIFEVVALLVPVLASKTKNAAAYRIWIIGAAFFMSIGSIQPKSTIVDFIEQKTTLGGEQISSSMIQIPLSHQFESVCNAKTATYDLTQLRDNAAKFNSRGIIDTFEMNVKGLIELMYQFLRLF